MTEKMTSLYNLITFQIQAHTIIHLGFNIIWSYDGNLNPATCAFDSDNRLSELIERANEREKVVAAAGGLGRSGHVAAAAVPFPRVRIRASEHEAGSGGGGVM